MGFNFIKFISLFEFFKNFVFDVVAVFATHKAEFRQEYTHVVNRHNLCKAESFAEFKVFCAAAGGDVNNADAFFRVNVLPRNDFMVDSLLSLKLGEAGFIVEADKLVTLEHSDNLKLIVAEVFDSVLCENEQAVVALYFNLNIVNLRVYRESHV